MNMHSSEPIVAPKTYPGLTSIELARTIVEHLRSNGERAPGEINDAIAAYCRRFSHVDDEVMKEALVTVQVLLRNPDAGRLPIEPLRKIEAVNIDEYDIGEIDDDAPTIEWHDPRSLFIDPAYQRNITEKGRKLIRAIVENFSWLKFAPPICAWTDFNGQRVLVVSDGQHRSIGCASHPGIEKIPVVVIPAKTVAQQAESFVALNSARLSVSKMQIHQSALIAGDVDAMTIERIANAVGVTILRSTSPRYEVGDTTSVGRIYTIFKNHGYERTKLILRTLARAKLCPIEEDHLKAATLLLTNPEYRNSFEPEALSEAIQGLSLVDRDDAKQLAVSKDMAFWKALAAVWFKRTKKSRKPKGGK